MKHIKNLSNTGQTVRAKHAERLLKLVDNLIKTAKMLELPYVKFSIKDLMNTDKGIKKETLIEFEDALRGKLIRGDYNLQPNSNFIINLEDDQ